MDPDAADMDRRTGEAGIAATSITGEQADKFAVILDPENGLWLHLAEGASLDHEADDEVMVTVTFTDSAGNTASQDVTVMVTDVNEAPEAAGMVANITTESGVALKDERIDLMALFNDPDAGDSSAMRYELSGGPDWLQFSVEFGEDGDGKDTTHGIFTGTPPTTGPDSDAAHMVTLTATDSGGAEGSVSFYVIVDDGNDDVTDVDFLIDGIVAVEAEVDENDASGVVLGEIRVSDQDHAMHPNGMHLIQILRAGQNNPDSPTALVDSRFEVKYDDEGIPWLVLKEGVALDEETTNGSVDVIIRAVDQNGDRLPAAQGGDFTGNVEFQTVSIRVNDQNDAPKANPIGNWWVTAEPGQRADDIEAGSWLTFGLEITGDDAAFTDPDGDSLTYSLSGPSILQINPRTGQITNVKGGVPIRGNHKFTVTATDPDGASASSSFYVAIALSGDGTDATADDDNEEPRFGTPNEFDYPENSGERRVATFTVTDDDNDLGHHPFALDTVRITSVVNPDDSSDTDNVGTVTAANQSTGYAAAFRLSDPVKNGDTWTYHLYVRDTNPSPMADSTAILDHEEVDRIRVTITADDSVALPETEEIDIRIDDVNDVPMAENIGDDPETTDVVETDFNLSSGADNYNGIEQSEDLKVILYIRLEDLWEDAEDQQDDLTYSASVSGSWLKILHGPAEWGDIEGIAWNDADVNDDGDPDREPVVIGDSGDPDANEQVVIIEIDRTGNNNGQGDQGSFTLTARDRDGGTGSKEYKITPTDKNLDPAIDAVELSGSPREDATLRASFNDDKDPDLAGPATPVLVLYQWFRVDADGTEEAAPFYQGTRDSYKLTQTDVDHTIRVKVKYYEVFQGQIVALNQATDLDPDTAGDQTAQADTSRLVSDTPDKGSGSITILADTNALTVAANGLSVSDADHGGAVPDTEVTISWQVSDNGRGGWEEVPTTAGTVSDNGDVTGGTLTLDSDGAGTSPAAAGNGQGKWYRAKATYDANGEDDGEPGPGDDEMESIYSDPIQVANIRDATPTAGGPRIEGSAFPGGTLTVNAGAATVDVQWQVSRGGNWVDIPGATGSSLSLTQANAGQTIRAVVSTQSTTPGSPGVTSVVAAPVTTGETNNAIPGGTDDSAAPVRIKHHWIETSVDAPGHGRDLNSDVDGVQAGHTLTLTETVDLRSLFQDPDSARLFFTVTNIDSTGLGANTGSGSTYVFESAPGGVLVFEVDTGTLVFNSDVYHGHDGDGTDGQGNYISLIINANDTPAPGGNDSASDASVNLRINVAPTGINFNDAADGTGTTGAAISVEEHVGFAVAPSPTGQFIARVNVLDENDSIGPDAHRFGTHDVTISGDDRFMITNTGNGRQDSDGDGSTWEVRLKPGAKLDFETESDADRAAAGKQIELTLTATDGGGLSTPPGAANVIKLIVTVTDVSVGDRNQPDAPNPSNVPGLNDNETTTLDDADEDTFESKDDPTDGDTDGGSPPPPPGTSLVGGLVEDFVDNMDAFGQDLLEDFMLVIDDGIDIA
ncbi:MAG: putative Ig domain-containing protein [Gemmatimonadota bacterium]|nr:putative Ig domain-containing protein [Gemmatimonadota bacterium]